MESYSVEAYLRAVGADQFSRSFDQAERQIDDFEKSTGNAEITVGKLITTISGIAAAVGVFRVLRDSVSLAFDRIDTMEQFDRVMTEITGSSENAKAALDATNEAVIGTAYGLDVAAKGVQDFVTRGLDVDKATERIAAWGDAVAFYGDGSNEQFAQVTDALAKMQTKGTVEMDQLNRLFDVGIDAVGMYAKATDKSAKDVQKALSKGEISAEDFIDTVTDAMMEGTNGVTDISGAAKEAGASWSGSFANMRAATARGVTNILGSIDEMLTKNGLPDMRQMVQNFGTTFESVLTWIANYLPIVVGYLMGFYNNFSFVFTSIRNVVVTVFTNIWTFIQEIFTLLMEFWNQHGEQLTESAQIIFTTIWEIVETSFLAIQEIIQTILEAVVPFIQEQLEKIREFWDENGEQIMEAVNNAFEFIKAVIQTVMPIVKGIIQTAWGAIRGIFETSIGVIMGLVETFSGLLTGDFTQIKEGLMRIWDSLFEGMRKAVKGAWGILSKPFKELWDFISNWFTNLISWAVDWGKDLILGFWEGIKAMGGWFKRKVTGFIDNYITGPIKGALRISSPSKLMKQYGSWTGEGLMQGIDSMKKKVQRASVDMAQSVNQGVQDNLMSQFNIPDVNGQVASINRQTAQSLTNSLQAELNVNRQPARIALTLGGNDFEAFVEDINEVNAVNATLRRF